MAADFIVVNRTNRPQQGSLLVSMANRLRELREISDNINDAGQHMFTGGDFSLFESQFGLAAGTGANTLTLIGLVNTILNGNADVTGANRLAQLDEFVARVAGQ